MGWEDDQFETGSIFKNEENQKNESTEDKINSTGVLSRAYTYTVMSDTLAMQIGRQDFDEAREWIYDAIQDAVRIYLFTRPYYAELSFSQGPEKLFEKNIDQGIRNLIINLRYKPRERFFVSAWFVDRKDTSNHNYSPSLYGIQVINIEPKRVI